MVISPKGYSTPRQTDWLTDWLTDSRNVLSTFDLRCRCPEIGASSIDWSQRSMPHLKAGTESSPRNVALNKNRPTTSVQKYTSCIELCEIYKRVHLCPMDSSKQSKNAIIFLFQHFIMHIKCKGIFLRPQTTHTCTSKSDIPTVLDPST
jgi:hypothetical protein